MSARDFLAVFSAVSVCQSDAVLLRELESIGTNNLSSPGTRTKVMRASLKQTGGARKRMKWRRSSRRRPRLNPQ